MWTAVSIIYDDLPDLGLAFLDIANNRMVDIDTLEIPQITCPNPPLLLKKFSI